VSGTYNNWVVLLSLLVAILASYTALALASRITASVGAAAASWLLGGAFAMGMGIWSMHFIGMLAFRLPIPLTYEIGTTLISMLIAIIVSGFALLTVTRPSLSSRRLAAGGVLMGIGIASMHYTGMAALPVQPGIEYDVTLFAASVVIAIAAATAALWISFTLRSHGARRIYARLGSAVIMGMAIVGMHYTGMAAANFAPDTICLSGGLADNSWMVATIAIITFLILCGTLALSVLDSKTAHMASSLKVANAELQHLVLHDTLTKLPNRLLLEDRLQQALAEGVRTGTRGAVLFIDLDRFKTLNDSLGHFAGDTVLRIVAERVRAVLGAEDTVARLGGDEFVALVKQVARAEEAGDIAHRIIESVARPIVIDERELRVASSIGISIFPDQGDDPARIIANADAAMYHVKKSGRSSFALFEPRMSTYLPKLELENELRTALQREEFVLHYQPRVDMRSGAIVGMEALVRWQHPRKGLVAPADFLPLAEKTGVIVPLGQWILREACEQARSWQERGIAGLTVSVNLSAVQFRQRDLVGTVARALDWSGLDARLLALEVAEGVLMDNPSVAIGILTELHRLRVGLSIDDFGTGRSSLTSLKLFPVDRLKIDGSFIRDIAAGGEDAAIVRAVIALAHGLRLRVVAEAVETEGQLEFLRALDADEYQGFLFAKPLAAREVARRMLLSDARGAGDLSPAPTGA
jgi:diguanylate cyclase (GGDEF)-like protein